MAFGLFKVIKGLLIKQENSLTPDQVQILPTATGSSTVTTIQATQTVNRTVSLPDATDTLVGKNTSDILTNKTIDGDDNTIQDVALSSLKTTLADADKFLVRDASGLVVSNTKAVPVGDVIGTSDSQTLTSKTIVVASNTITTAASGNLIATELNSALSELQSDIDTRATSTSLSNHINNTTDAHDASAISVIPSGNLSSTEVQAALVELQGDVDGKFSSSGGTLSGNVDLNNNFITNVPTPTANDHVANKSYVDSLSAGLDPKASCIVATLSDLGATYTSSPSNGRFTSAPSSIDSVSLSIGDRVLVKNQADQKENGIYVYDAVNQLTRASDMDGSPSSEVSSGNFAFITSGTTNVGKGYTLLGTGILTLNTDNLVWSQFSGTENTANKTLSNLNSPTAINQDLLFSKAYARLKTEDKTGSNSSESLTISTGDISSGTTGASAGISISSGDISGGTGGSGSVSISTGLSSNRGKVLLGGKTVRILATSATDPSTPETGDIYYNTGTNSLRYYNGTFWSDLGASGASTVSSLSIYSAVQYFPHATVTTINPDNIIYNVGSGYSNGTGIFTAPENGLYQGVAYINMSSMTPNTGEMHIGAIWGASLENSTRIARSAIVGGSDGISGLITVQLSTGDQFALQLYQTNGTTRTNESGFGYVQFTKVGNM